MNSKVDINTIFDKESAKIVGRVLKRVDLYHNDINLLKSSLKETIYEELRNLRDLLIYLQIPHITFNAKK